MRQACGQHALTRLDDRSCSRAKGAKCPLMPPACRMARRLDTAWLPLMRSLSAWTDRKHHASGRKACCFAPTPWPLSGQAPRSDLASYRTTGVRGNHRGTESSSHRQAESHNAPSRRRADRKETARDPRRASAAFTALSLNLPAPLQPGGKRWGSARRTKCAGHKPRAWRNTAPRGTPPQQAEPWSGQLP